MICKHILLLTFLNESVLIFLHTVKWFPVFLLVGWFYCVSTHFGSFNAESIF